MKKNALILWALVCIAGSSFGQSGEDFESKYGSEKYYKVRQFTLVRPKFDKQGQICRAAVKPNHFAEGMVEGLPAAFTHRPVYSSMDKERLLPIFVLDQQELKEIFAELVPPGSRIGEGKASIDHSGFGASYTVGFKFENVSIYTSVAILEENIRIDIGAIGNNIDRFFDPPFGKIVQAEIVWNKRSCAKN